MEIKKAIYDIVSYTKSTVVCCGEEAKRDPMIYTSSPPQYKFFCPKCSSSMYVDCDDINGSYQMKLREVKESE